MGSKSQKDVQVHRGSGYQFRYLQVETAAGEESSVGAATGYVLAGFHHMDRHSMARTEIRVASAGTTFLAAKLGRLLASLLEV